MILEEIQNIRSDKGVLRKFGVTMGVIFGLLGGLLLWRGRDSYPYFLILSFLFVVSGFFLRRLLIPVYKGWVAFAIVIGWIMTRVILMVLFYMFFTPIGFFARSFGKDMLTRRFDQNRQSYWIPKNKINEFDKINYENQY